MRAHRHKEYLQKLREIDIEKKTDADAHQKMKNPEYKKAGTYQKAGKTRDEGTRETNGEKTPSTTDAEDRRNRETKDRDVHEGRKKTSQVEQLTVADIPTESDSFDRKNRTDV
jgi:hypothetical protein